jgi:hypothetical protein
MAADLSPIFDSFLSVAVAGVGVWARQLGWQSDRYDHRHGAEDKPEEEMKK